MNSEKIKLFMRNLYLAIVYLMIVRTIYVTIAAIIYTIANR